MKIYTKTGDAGTTGLFAGPRVSKDHPRINAYGTLDELNALLGVLRSILNDSSTEPPADWEEKLKQIQHDLFALGAQLATPDPDRHGMFILDDQRVAELENWIDGFEDQLPPLTNFILPGGCMASSMFHLARTVCRRAEREVVHLAAAESAAATQAAFERAIVYLNRLSDLLFVWSRASNADRGIPDDPWCRPTE